MNICIITSSFPTKDSDPLSGWILDFCLNLANTHNVTVITAKRADQYDINKKINLVTFERKGRDIALADLKFYKIRHLFYMVNLFSNAKKALDKYAKTNKVDRSFSFWAVPSGIGSFYLYRKYNIPYDVWCLGSD